MKWLSWDDTNNTSCTINSQPSAVMYARLFMNNKKEFAKNNKDNLRIVKKSGKGAYEQQKSYN